VLNLNYLSANWLVVFYLSGSSWKGAAEKVVDELCDMLEENGQELNELSEILAVKFYSYYAHIYGKTHR